MDRTHYIANQTVLVSSASSSPNGTISPSPTRRNPHPIDQQQQRRRRVFHGRRPTQQPKTRIPYNSFSCNPRFPPQRPSNLDDDDDLEPRQYGRERFFEPPPTESILPASPRNPYPPHDYFQRKPNPIAHPNTSETYLYIRIILLLLAGVITVTAAFRTNWLAVFLGLWFVLKDMYGLLRDLLDWYVGVVLEEEVVDGGW